MKYEQQIEKCLYKNMKELKALQNEANNQSSIISNQLKGEPNPQLRATSDESRATNQKVSPPIHSAGSPPNMEDPQLQGEPKNNEHPTMNNEPIIQNKPNLESRATNNESRATNNNLLINQPDIGQPGEVG